MRAELERLLQRVVALKHGGHGALEEEIVRTDRRLDDIVKLVGGYEQEKVKAEKDKAAQG